LLIDYGAHPIITSSYSLGNNRPRIERCISLSHRAVKVAEHDLAAARADLLRGVTKEFLEP
jgi:hypothetical protein